MKKIHVLNLSIGGLNNLADQMDVIGVGAVTVHMYIDITGFAIRWAGSDREVLQQRDDNMGHGTNQRPTL